MLVIFFHVNTCTTLSLLDMFERQFIYTLGCPHTFNFHLTMFTNLFLWLCLIFNISLFVYLIILSILLHVYVAIFIYISKHWKHHQTKCFSVCLPIPSCTCQKDWIYSIFKVQLLKFLSKINKCLNHVDIELAWI